MVRISLLGRDGSPLGDLTPDEMLSCVRVEEINGEHSLTIETERHLEEGTRAAFRDAGGRWHEFVLDEPAETHDSGPHAVGSYHFVWSLQYDLQTVCGSVRQPGMASPASARRALSDALDGTVRWNVGNVDVKTRSGCIMAYDTAWDRISAVVKYWGGEVDARVVAGGTGVGSRVVDLLEHVGDRTPTRRFEWDHSLTSISRTPDPGPYVCRLIPYGSGEQDYADDGETTFEYKLGIESVNGGRSYIQDDEAAMAFRVRTGATWEYPTCVVDYSTDDPEELIQLARADLHSHTRPQVSYEGSVSQFAAAGMNVRGIGLGDEVQVVDRGFNANAPLRVQARVLRVEIDELGVEDVRLTIGRLNQTLEKTMASTIKAVGKKAVSAVMPDTSARPVAVPNLSTYEVTKPDTGEVVSVPTTTYEPVSYDPAPSVDLSGIESRIGAIESGVADVGSGSGSGLYGDGWTHQIDGTTEQSGTINFVTTGSSSEPSKGSDPNEWGKTSKKAGGAAGAAAWGNGSSGGGFVDMGGGSWGSEGGDF